MGIPSTLGSGAAVFPLSRFWQGAKQTLQLLTKMKEGRSTCSALQMNHHVDRFEIFPARPAPENLSDPSFDLLTDHGRSHVFFARGDPQPGLGLEARSNIEDHKRPVLPAATLITSFVVGTSAEPLVAAKALLGGGAKPAHVDPRAGLDGQTLAALAAAGGENGLTVAGAHTNAEAMGLLATTIIGLKRPFHG